MLPYVKLHTTFRQLLKPSVIMRALLKIHGRTCCNIIWSHIKNQTKIGAGPKNENMHIVITCTALQVNVNEHVSKQTTKKKRLLRCSINYLHPITILIHRNL
jgi:hypothetical protein